jgi:hypothetical protein
MRYEGKILARPDAFSLCRRVLLVHAFIFKIEKLVSVFGVKVGTSNTVDARLFLYR